MDETREERLLALILLHRRRLHSIIHNSNYHRPMSKAKALERMKKSSPSTYNKVKALIEQHECLWNLPFDKFQELCGQTLRQLVKEGHCKKPLSDDVLRARHVLAI